MCRKARLAECLNPWLNELPDAFAFAPKTWILPNDAADLESAMAKSKDIFIVKPSAGSQGKGIILVRKWKDIAAIVQKSKGYEDFGKQRNLQEYVVQRYIADPLLLDGMKFDLRLYAIVTSVVPLRAYLFKEGLARFCTVPYQSPTDENLHEACMHLTNFALNKKSKDFHAGDGLAQHDEGSKRSASAVFQQIHELRGVPPAEMWSRVAVLLANTLMAMRPSLLDYYVHDRQRPLHPFAPKAFQLIGFDVMIDDSLEPKLIELNANASLSALQPGSGAEQSDVADAAGLSASPIPPPSPTPPPSEASENAALSVPAPGASPPDTPAPPQMSPEELQMPAVPPTPPIAPPPVPQAEVGSSACGRKSRHSAAGLPADSPTRSAPRRSPSLSKQSRTRLGMTAPDSGLPKPEKVVSELDLEVKRELVAQALLLVRPAPQALVARMKKLWSDKGSARFMGELVPLDDSGEYLLPFKRSKAEATRKDTPERCPAVEALDLEGLAAPEVTAYAHAHQLLYRCWRRCIGMQSGGAVTLRQGAVLKLLERIGVVGEGCLHSGRISAQLWLTNVWRDIADGAFGLDFLQFIVFAGKTGRLLLGGAWEAPAADDGPSFIQGVLEFSSRPGLDPPAS
eukprot:TRINITY_DN11916_c0_g1_i4.p1 TRINITY_DN11916_c0_g1~~TRINITY_DN11916_c0_g1_i4.p1  ORF type:complete len:626 (+),score=115.16 TRINITY_DN11916_c0_g1_i4:599-2476(+)